MAIVFTNAGEAIALRNIVNNTPPQTLVIKLYSNNRTPTKLDTATDYTENLETANNLCICIIDNTISRTTKA